MFFFSLNLGGVFLTIKKSYCLNGIVGAFIQGVRLRKVFFRTRYGVLFSLCTQVDLFCNWVFTDIKPRKIIFVHVCHTHSEASPWISILRKYCLRRYHPLSKRILNFKSIKAAKSTSYKVEQSFQMHLLWTKQNLHWRMLFNQICLWMVLNRSCPTCCWTFLRAGML